MLEKIVDTLLEGRISERGDVAGHVSGTAFAREVGKDSTVLRVEEVFAREVAVIDGEQAEERFVRHLVGEVVLAGARPEASLRGRDEGIRKIEAQAGIKYPYHFVWVDGGNDVGGVVRFPKNTYSRVYKVNSDGDVLWLEERAQASGEEYWEVVDGETVVHVNGFSGVGTEEDPWQVKDINDLQGVGSNAGAYVGWTRDSYYLQVSDIEAGMTAGWNSGAGFLPRGTSFATSFIGHYNGDGHVVRGLIINRPSNQYNGLFGYCNGGVIIGLGLVDCNITGNTDNGAFVGLQNSVNDVIQFCFSTGSVTGGTRTGGMVGYSRGQIHNSYSQSAVVSTNNQAGGLLGNRLSGSFITHCYSSGAVSGAGTLGGLIGVSGGGSVVDSYWDTESSGRATSAGGTGKTTAEMYVKATYAGWDWINTWGIAEYAGYPELQIFRVRRYPESREYYLEVRNDSGGLVRHVRDWHSGRLEETLNQPRQLSVVVPWDADLAEQFEPPNELWLYDRERVLIDRFSFSQVTAGGVSSRKIDIEGVGLLGMLGRVWVPEYIESDKTIAELLTAILGYQSVISLGAVDVVGTYTVSWENMTVLQCINALVKQSGGYFWVVPQTLKLNWLESPGEDIGQQIRFGRNLQNISRRRDYTGIANTVWAYGDGVALASPVEDAASIAAYGVREYSIVDKRVKHEATLTTLATMEIARRKDPILQYTVDGIDLSRILEGDYRFDRWELGSQYRVIDEVYGIEATLRAHRIIRDLDNPLNNTIELVSLRRPVSDLFGQIKEDMLALQNVAADITRSDENPLPIGTAHPGVSEQVSRADHVHEGAGITLSDANPLAVGDTAAPGTSDEASRADHVHPLGDISGQIQDVIDEMDLPVPEPAMSAPPNIDVSGDVGTSLLYARQDHTHGGQRQPATATPLPVAETGAVGSSVQYARADHVHAGVTAGDLEDIAGAILSDANPENTGWVAAPGEAEEASRADHVHVNDGRMVPASGFGSPPGTAGQAHFVVAHGQLWARLQGQTRYYPIQQMTTETGT